MAESDVPRITPEVVHEAPRPIGWIAFPAVNYAFIELFIDRPQLPFDAIARGHGTGHTADLTIPSLITGQDLIPDVENIRPERSVPDQRDSSPVVGRRSRVGVDQRKP